jgi:hypothetical protein
MRGLSNLQKATLARAARAAWASRGMVGDNAAFTDWRHAEQQAAVGCGSLRDCGQDDFLPLLAHFQDLAGETGTAVKTILRHAEEPRIIAMRKLAESLAERGLGTAYAEAICTRQFRTGLTDASAKQIWCVNFTVRNRRKPNGAAAKLPRRIHAQTGTGSLSVPQIRPEEVPF